MRRMAVLAVALVVVATVGVLLTRGQGDSASTPFATPTSLLTMAGADVAAVHRGRDLEPARRAAIRAVAMTGAVVRAGFISRRGLIESFTTPDFGPTLAASTSEAVTATLLELGQRDADVSTLAVLEQPITATVEATSAGAQVRVWSVLVVAAPRVGPGRQVWRTVTLDMVEAGERWLVDGWRSTPGPSPAPPAEGAYDDAAAFVAPLSWPPASPTSATTGAG
jgi:hypothetical protein